MIQRALRISCVALLIAGFWTVREAASRPPALTAARDPALADAADADRVGARFTVDVREMRDVLATLRFDERGEQLADWAVYGTLLHLGLGPEQLAEATYYTAPVRDPSLEEVLDFSHGPGRRVFLPDGRVALFTSVFDEHPKATLARLADQVVMERDETPISYMVFTYRSDQARGVVEVERQTDLRYAQVFSDEYGYRYATAYTVDDLRRWLESTDDLTSARAVPDGGLELKGRRFDDARTLGVNLEDVAALYQAHRVLQADGWTDRGPGFSLDPAWDRPALLRDLERLRDEPEAFLNDLYDEYQRDLARERAEIAANPAAADARRGVVAGAEDLFAETVPVIADQLRHPRARAEIARLADLAATGADWELRAAFSPWFWTEGRRIEEWEPVVVGVANLIHERNEIQCARYDGPLQGTHVGMVLFYTDLLAKLWHSIDYYRTAPLADIPGFWTHPQHLPTIEAQFDEEFLKLPAARLWFGFRGDAYSGDVGASGLRFEHVFARMYNMGNDGKRHDEYGHPLESPTAEGYRRGMGAWNRHFAPIADHEPQYHALNQITKWSIVTGWLAAEGQWAGLSAVPVDHSLRFDRWFAGHDELRFRGDVRFTPEQRWHGGTECIENLHSRFYFAHGTGMVMTGGVTLPSRAALKPARTLELDVPLGLRVKSLDRQASSLSGGLKSVKGTEYKFAATPGGKRIDTTVAADARLRHGGHDFAAGGRPIGGLQTEITGTSRRGTLALKLRDGAVGDGVRGDIVLARLGYERSKGGVRLTREPVAAAGGQAERSVFERAGWTAEGDVGTHLAQNPVLRPDRGTFVVASETRGPKVIALADDGGAARVTQPLFYDKQLGKVYGAEQKTGSLGDAMAAVDAMPYQRLAPLRGVADGPGRVQRVFQDIPPPKDARRVVVKTGDPELGEVEGFIARGEVYLVRPKDLSKSGAFNELVTRGELTSDVVSRLGADTGGVLALPRATLSHGRGEQAAQLLAAGRSREALALLRESAGRGELRETVASAQSVFAGRRAPELTGGRHIPAARRFADGTLVQRTAAHRKLEAAPESLRNATDVVQLGDRAVTRTRLDALSGGEVVDGGKMHLLGDVLKNPDRASIYVQDARALARYDWDGTPTQSLAAALRDPRVRVERLTEHPFQDFRPDLLTRGDRRLVRRTVAEEAPEPEGLAPWKLGPLVLVALADDKRDDCDEDDDGEVSADERRRCEEDERARAAR